MNLFLFLIHDLMLVLKILYDQHSPFYHTNYILAFYILYISILDISSTHMNPSTGNFSDIAFSYKLL